MYWPKKFCDGGRADGRCRFGPLPWAISLPSSKKIEATWTNERTHKKKHNTKKNITQKKNFTFEYDGYFFVVVVVSFYFSSYSLHVFTGLTLIVFYFFFPPSTCHFLLSSIGDGLLISARVSGVNPKVGTRGILSLIRWVYRSIHFSIKSKFFFPSFFSFFGQCLKHVRDFVNKSRPSHIFLTEQRKCRVLHVICIGNKETGSLDQTYKSSSWKIPLVKCNTKTVGKCYIIKL